MPGTPLRYPGGKQKLAPFLFEILRDNDLIGGDYIEVYAGGAGAAIELLLQKAVNRIHLNDSSYPIYSFWNTLLNHPDKLCRSIRSASLTIEEWRKRRHIVQNFRDYEQFEVGYSAFYLNRCNRSGVISGGVIGGIEQNGKWKMDARFSRNELIRRIEVISKYSSQIVLNNLDAEVYIKEYLSNSSSPSLVYFDPPYYEKSSGLYLDKYKKGDHKHLSNVIQTEVKSKWVLSYDCAAEILEYYQNKRKILYDLQYNASTVYKGKEVFIFSDKLNIPRTSSLRYINQALLSNTKV